MVTARKQRLSNKRLSIKGKHVVSTAEILKMVEDAEKVTQQRKRKHGQCGQMHDNSSFSRVEATSESEQELSELEESVMKDCNVIELL